MTEVEALLEHELAAFHKCTDEAAKGYILKRIKMYEREVEAERELASVKEA